IAQGEAGSALVMQSDDGLGRALVTIGDDAALDALLSVHPGPRSNYLATGAPSHLPVLQRYFDVENTIEMRRMTVDRLRFAHVDGMVRRLNGGDVRALNALYSS